MAAIENITVSEIQEFYPVTASLTQDKINTYMNTVKNLVFLQMFGNAISSKIMAGTITDSANDDFIGFRKFTALCIAAQMAQEVYTHTNAGLKAINQPNWTSPTTVEKNSLLVQLNNAVETQFLEAKKVLEAGNETPKNDYEGLTSFNFEKI